MKNQRVSYRLQSDNLSTHSPAITLLPFNASICLITFLSVTVVSNIVTTLYVLRCVDTALFQNVFSIFLNFIEFFTTYVLFLLCISVLNRDYNFALGDVIEIQ